MSAYSVQATKKGAAPLTVEKRKFGKHVTILPCRSIKGDAQLLLTHLKAALGTGGTVDNEALELQGDRVEAAAAWLSKHDVLKGGCKRTALAASSSAPAVATPQEPPPTPPPPKGFVDNVRAPTATSAAKVGSSEYGRFVALMKSWIFWDQDYSQLDRRWAEHKATRCAMGALQGLDQLSSSCTSTGSSNLTRGRHVENSTAELDAVLRELGMLAAARAARHPPEKRLPASKEPRHQPADKERAREQSTWTRALSGDAAAAAGGNVWMGRAVAVPTAPMRPAGGLPTRVNTDAVARLGPRASHHSSTSSSSGSSRHRSTAGRARVVSMHPRGSMQRSDAVSARRPLPVLDDSDAEWEDDNDEWYSDHRPSEPSSSTMFGDYFTSLPQAERNSQPQHVGHSADIDDEEDAALQLALAISISESAGSNGAGGVRGLPTSSQSGVSSRSWLGMVEMRLQAQREEWQLRQVQQEGAQRHEWTSELQPGRADEADEADELGLDELGLSEEEALALAMSLSEAECSSSVDGWGHGGGERDEDGAGMLPEPLPLPLQRPSSREAQLPPGLGSFHSAGMGVAPPGLKPLNVPVPEYTDEDFLIPAEAANDLGGEEVGHHQHQPTDTAPLQAWALDRLGLVMMDEAPIEASVLLDYLLAIDDDAELLDYCEAFLGASEGVTCFALELAQRRRAFPPSPSPKPPHSTPLPSPPPSPPTSKAAVRRSEEETAAARHALARMARIVILDEERCKPDTPAFDFLRKCASCPPPSCPNSGGCIWILEARRCQVREDACPACLNKAKRCPGSAVRIVNVPNSLAPKTSHRFGPNSFKLHRLPTPRPNQVLGLIGTNGIGKSTALQILSGRLQPNLGRVAERGDAPQCTWDDVLAHYRGSELQGFFTRLIGQQLRSVTKPQYVDLLPHHLPGWSVKALLAAIDKRGVRASIVSTLDLTPLLERTVEQLSGGELQRLAIALVLVQEAEVYLFDEPSSFLDVAQRLKVARAIRGLAGPSTYVVAVEHDLSLLDYLSDSICLCYGVRGAYGVAAASMGTREGINAFLMGYLPTENLRFRSEGLSFKPTAESLLPGEEAAQRRAAVETTYPSFTHRIGSFILTVEGGSLSSGQTVALLGENGMGKTLFVRLLAGQMAEAAETADHSSGGVSLAGRLPRLHTSYKPQRLATHRVGGSVQNLLQLHISDALGHPRFVAEVLTPLRVDALLEHNVASLSGGELQIVAIAIALGTPADLYLLDEPSAYLDSEQRIAAARVLKRFIQTTHKVALVVEHDFMMATYLADRVIVYRGTPAIAATATAPQPLQSGMNAFLRGLDVSFRRDPETHRPRINKPNSGLDKEQKAAGNYFHLDD